MSKVRRVWTRIHTPDLLRRIRIQTGSDKVYILMNLILCLTKINKMKSFLPDVKIHHVLFLMHLIHQVSIEIVQ
jgi:hypothetical protein